MSVADLIDKLGMTRAEFAKSLNITDRTVYRWVSGESEPQGLASEVVNALELALQEGVSPERIRSKIRLGLAAFLYFTITSALTDDRSDTSS